MRFLNILIVHAIELIALWLILRRTGSTRALALSSFVVSMQMAAWVRFVTGGWLLLLFIPVFISHVALSIFVLANRRSQTNGVAAGAFAFLLASLFVRDAGDGPGWIPIVVLIQGGDLGAYREIPLWASNPAFLLVVIVCVLYSWGWMLLRTTPED